MQRQLFLKNTAGRSLGVSGALIGRWKRQMEDDAAKAFPGKGKRTAEQQRIHTQDIQPPQATLRSAPGCERSARRGV
jgi:transposase-like protein